MEIRLYADEVDNFIYYTGNDDFNLYLIKEAFHFRELATIFGRDVRVFPSVKYFESFNKFRKGVKKQYDEDHKNDSHEISYKDFLLKHKKIFESRQARRKNV